MIIADMDMSYDLYFNFMNTFEALSMLEVISINILKIWERSSMISNNTYLNRNTVTRDSLTDDVLTMNIRVRIKYDIFKAIQVYPIKTESF